MADLTPHNASLQTVSAIAVSAAFMFIGGAWFGEAWPAAVAVCGLALMGAVVGFFQLRAK